MFYVNKQSTANDKRLVCSDILKFTKSGFLTSRIVHQFTRQADKQKCIVLINCVHVMS